QAEAGGGDNDRHDGETIEAVGEVHGIAGADDDEGAEDHEPPAEIDDDILQERNRQRGGGGVAAELGQRVAGHQRDDPLQQQANAASKTAGGLLGDLQIVVIEADEAEAERHRQHDPDI